MSAKSEVNCPAATRAKKLVINLATNFQNPESLVSQPDAANPASLLAETYQMIRLVGSALRQAFETSDAYERDWCLLWARVVNAKAQMWPFGNVPSLVPMAEGSQIDVCVSYVQQNLAKKMAICAWKDCKAYFFKGPGRSAYCSKRCSRAKINAGNLRYWNQVGSAKRKRKATRRQVGRVKRKARVAILRLADRTI